MGLAEHDEAEHPNTHTVGIVGVHLPKPGYEACGGEPAAGVVCGDDADAGAGADPAAGLALFASGVPVEVATGLDCDEVPSVAATRLDVVVVVEVVLELVLLSLWREMGQWTSSRDLAITTRGPGTYAQRQVWRQPKKRKIHMYRDRILTG